MTEQEDGLPAWPPYPEGWDATAAVLRRTSTLFVGAIIFVFDDSVRVYRKGVSGGPVHRYKFAPRKIMSETSRSWLVAQSSWSRPEHYDKVSKKDLSKVYGLQDVEEALWVSANQYKIAGAVSSMRGPQSFEKLQAIAQIVGLAP